MPIGLDHRRSGWGYLVARGYVFACGIFILGSTIGSQFMTPELYYDQGPAPPWKERALDIFLALAASLLFILPYRWSARGWAFRSRLALMLAASLRLGYLAAAGVHGFIMARSHWSIVPASLLALALAVLAPLALVWRNRVMTRIVAQEPVMLAGPSTR